MWCCTSILLFLASGHNVLTAQFTLVRTSTTEESNEPHGNAFQACMEILQRALFSLSCLNTVQTGMSIIKSLFLSQVVTCSPFFSLSLEFFMIQANLFKWQSRSLCNVASSQNCDLFNSEVKWQHFDYRDAFVLEQGKLFFLLYQPKSFLPYGWLLGMEKSSNFAKLSKAGDKIFHVFLWHSWNVVSIPRNSC